MAHLIDGLVVIALVYIGLDLFLGSIFNNQDKK